jgi:hypothetical protein
MKLTPLKAIRAKCLDCSGMSAKEVRECEFTECPLYPFRFGKNPSRKGIGGNIQNAKILQKSRVESG